MLPNVQFKYNRDIDETEIYVMSGTCLIELKKIPGKVSHHIKKEIKNEIKEEYKRKEK